VLRIRSPRRVRTRTCVQEGLGAARTAGRVGDSKPNFAEAFPNSAGAELAELEGYLKVPYLDDERALLVARISCPWGYSHDLAEAWSGGPILAIVETVLRREGNDVRAGSAR